ncbi:MAG: tripartite tricarboxylate transporter permease, partial [Shinella sp.]
MDLLNSVMMGFVEVATPINLTLCFVGVFLGTAIGVLPGVGPSATLAMLLPVTYFLPPVAALIMLAGIYYGAQYGGSTTAILVNMPGEASSVVTAIDGHQMARQGKAGLALAAAALASFMAGMLGNVVIILLAPWLATMALSFGPAEYVSLAVFGLISSCLLVSGSLLQSAGMILVGLLLGLVGIDVNSGGSRMSFGSVYLYDGISFIVLSVAFFAIAEIMTNLEEPDEKRPVLDSRIRLRSMGPELKKIIGPSLRGTALGTLIGILPGGGATLSAFMAYAFEKRISRTPERFGHGAIEGVAAPEAANNSGAQANLIPMLILGIPTGGVTAIMLGALMIHGVAAGPKIIEQHADLFWAFIVSMWIGNIMLVILNLPLVGLWVRLISVPYRLLYPAILLFCCVGVYSVNSSTFDLLMVAGMAALAWLMRKARLNPVPLALGFVLGPLLETNIRRMLLIS